MKSHCISNVNKRTFISTAFSASQVPAISALPNERQRIRPIVMNAYSDVFI